MDLLKITLCMNRLNQIRQWLINLDDLDHLYSEPFIQLAEDIQVPLERDHMVEMLRAKLIRMGEYIVLKELVDLKVHLPSHCFLPIQP